MKLAEMISKYKTFSSKLVLHIHLGTLILYIFIDVNLYYIHTYIYNNHNASSICIEETKTKLSYFF